MLRSDPSGKMIKGWGSGAVIIRSDQQDLTLPYNQGRGQNIYLAFRTLQPNYSTTVNYV